VTPRTVTQSIETEAEPDTIFDLLADPRHLPAWAPAFADAIAGDERQGWQAVKNGRAFSLRVATEQHSRTVDYLRDIGSGREGGAYIRVVPGLAGGSVIVMTVPLPPNTSSDAVAAGLRKELETLARLTKRV